MDFALSEERQMLADTVRRFVDDTYDIATRHANARRENGFDPKTWLEFAELGLIGALQPAHVGGYGGAGEDIAIVFETIGRGLVVEPFLASGVLGASPIVLAGSTPQREVLAGVIAGTHQLALAHGEPSGRYALSHVTTRATPNDDNWTINGRKAVVINGDSADTLIVSARINGGSDDLNGICLFAVDAKTEGISRRGYTTVDGGRAAEIEFNDVVVGAGALLGKAGEGFSLIETTHARGIVAVCAEAIGIMDVSKDITLDYLRARKQFGRPIGAFQALQHRMVDLLIEIEQARSAVILAAGSLEADRPVRERNVSAAKNLVGRVGRLVAEETIQLHGGIAMTWEYSLPHYAKRLTMIDHQLGDTDFHLERFQKFANEVA
ncbi:MAG: acyl-CoA dehydrogenase family protein [Hyphomicrobiaceae bacterium]